VAVPDDGPGTASVEAEISLPGRKTVLGLSRGGAEKNAEKPVGLQMRPTWWRRDRLGACPAVGRGVGDCQLWRPLPWRR
jgi:hypothetical protein